MFRGAALATMVSLFVASSARADDWLALYPECGFGPEARALGRMAMVYPRPGLPAVVEAGERLVTRVRVPSGLTPPPGVQKDRALAGWSAELVGQSTALGDPTEHRYRTRVVDVRPDGQSTLVYRASIEVPRWAAPGTYGIRLRAPGGSDAVAGAVRIIEPGASPTFLLLPALTTDASETHDALLRALSMLSYDVVVTEDASLLGALSSRAPASPTAPVLVYDPDAPIVLRAGTEALLFGACDDRYTPFDAQVEGLAAREARTTRPFAELVQTLDRWRGAAESTTTIEVGEERVDVTAPAARDVELTVRYPDDGRGLAIEGSGAATFHPAVSIPMRGEVRTLAARLRVERGERVSVARVEASAPEAEIHITPGAPRSGDVVHLAVTGEELAQVAWRLEEDATFVGPEISHLYRPVGDELVHVFVISSAGVGAELTATVKIETREVRGCGGCGAAFPSGSLAGFADLWLFGLVLLRMGSPRRNRPSLRAR